MAVFTIPYPATGLTMYAGIYDSSGSIWDGAAYVTLASLNDITAWQDLLYEALELELDDATGASIYQTEDITVTGYDEVIFYSGSPPATYNAVASLSTDASVTDIGAGVWAYLTASADVLGLSTMGGWLRSLLSTSTVNVTSLSVVTQSDMEIVSGDAYDTTTNQSITFADDKTWPVLSPTNTVCVVAPLSNPLSTLFTATCTVSGNSPAQVIYIPFTAAQTSLLVPGNVYYHKVKTILSNTEVRTLVLGQITVK